MEEQNFELLQTLTALYDLYMTDPVVRRKVKEKLSTPQQVTTTPQSVYAETTKDKGGGKDEEVAVNNFFNNTF